MKKNTGDSDSSIPKGHLNMKALGEREGIQEYQDVPSFMELLAAKKALIQLLVRNKNSLFVVRGETDYMHREQVYLTLCNELICHVIRDDSPLAARDVDSRSGLEASCGESIQVASLRERVEIEAHYRNERPFSELLAEVSRLKIAQGRYMEEHALEKREIMPIRIWGALHPNIKKYGKILQLEDGPVADGLLDKPFYYVNGEVTRVKMGGESPVEIGRIVIKKRPFTLFVMDHHEYTSEVLTPDRHCIIPFSDQAALESRCFNGELFMVPPGAWIHINEKTIHYAPFPLFEGVLTSSVIFAEGTTTAKKADFHHHHFSAKRRFL